MAIKLSKNTPSITVQLSQKDFDRLNEHARRAETSVSHLTKVAILWLITQVEKGEALRGVLTEFRTGIEPGNA